MKKPIYFIAFLCTFFSYGQIIVKNDSTVFKQCNAIEISTNKSAEELYKLCGDQLIRVCGLSTSNPLSNQKLVA